MAEYEFSQEVNVLSTSESILTRAIGSLYPEEVQLGFDERGGSIHGVINVDTRGTCIPRLAIIKKDGMVEKRRPQGCAYLSNLSVRPESRRKGIGRSLILEAENVAKDWGSWGAALHCDTVNDDAYDLYLKLGYTAPPGTSTDKNNCIFLAKVF